MTTKFVILYTHQKTKKSKAWQDGTLTISKDGNKGYLKNENGQNIDTIQIKKEINVGDDLESAKFLIQIDDVVTAEFEENMKNSARKVCDSLSDDSSQGLDTEKSIKNQKKLPKFSKHAVKQSDSNLETNEKQNKTLKCSANVPKRKSTLQTDKNESEDGEKPTIHMGVKKRKKFCAPRRVGAPIMSQESILSLNENGDEFSDMECVVVRQNVTGIWQTIEHNQPQDGRKGSRQQDGGRGRQRHHPHGGARRHQPPGTSSPQPLAERRTFVASGSNTVKNVVSMETNDKGGATTRQDQMKPVRSAKEVLDIIRRAKKSKKMDKDLTAQNMTNTSPEQDGQLTKKMREIGPNCKNQAPFEPQILPRSKLQDQDDMPPTKEQPDCLNSENVQPMKFGLFLENEQPLFSIDDEGQEFEPNFAFDVDL